MTKSVVFHEFGYFTSWWSTIIILLVIIAGILIILKICLDCTGLCGHNLDAQTPMYKLDIVYKGQQKEEEEEDSEEDIESQSEEDQDHFSRRQ